MKYQLILSILFSISFSLSYAQQPDGPPNPDPGKCYAKCLILLDEAKDLKIDSTLTTYPEYTGTDSTVAIVKERVLVGNSRYTWVKRKGDRNCLSKKPDDCLVWCLIKKPTEYTTISKVKNVSRVPSSDIEYKIVVSYQYSEDIPSFPYEYSQWREVLCGSKVTSYTIRTIQEALRNKGYDPGPSNNILGARTKHALTLYQKDNKLPVGQLDLETLRSLGID